MGGGGARGGGRRGGGGRGGGEGGGVWGDGRSNVFVEPETLPSALEAFVNANPISILATASRGLMEGSASGGDIAIVLATAGALTAVFAPLTTRLYRSRS